MKITKESIFLTFYFFFLILPFTAFQWNYDGYELPKYLLILFFSIVFSIFLFKAKEFVLPSKYLIYFLISFVISTIFSESFLYSFYGDYPRLNQNLILVTSILIIGIILKNYLKNLDIYKLIFIQSLFLTFISLFENTDRTISTLGQPNFLGIVIVLGIMYSFKNLSERKIYLISIIFLLIGLIKTASITSILCLFTYLTYLLFKNWREYLKYVVSLTFIIFFLISFSTTTKNKIEDNIKIILNNKNTVITDSLIVRFSIWEDSIKIPLSNLKFFLIGTGPETFSLFYENFRGKNINLTSEWDSFIDKPHNYFLEILIEQGIVGLILINLILVKYFKTSIPNKSYLAVILIYLFFNWANIFLQFIIFLILYKDLESNVKVQNNNYIKISIILFIFIILFSFKLYRFDEIENKPDYYKIKNPVVKIQGLDYFRDKELKEYTAYLKENYPQNLKILFEVYKVEKRYSFEEKELTKITIKELREDLIDWHPEFRD